MVCDMSPYGLVTCGVDTLVLLWKVTCNIVHREETYIVFFFNSTPRALKFYLKNAHPMILIPPPYQESLLSNVKHIMRLKCYMNDIVCGSVVRHFISSLLYF